MRIYLLFLYIIGTIFPISVNIWWNMYELFGTYYIKYYIY